MLTLLHKYDTRLRNPNERLDHEVTEPIVKTGVQIAIDKIRRAYGEE